MAPINYNPADEMPDLDGCGGTIGGPTGTPNAGPLQFPQDQDPYPWELHYVGAGGTANNHGLFGKLLNAAYYLWNRAGRVISPFDGTFFYDGAAFALGLISPITAMTGSGVPIVCTISSTANMLAGMQVTISGATGNPAANGTWRIQILNGTQFQLKGSTGNGTYSGSAFVKYPQTVWGALKFLADNAATTFDHGVAPQGFAGDQFFAGNVAVGGNLSVVGALLFQILGISTYLSRPTIAQSPAFTTSGGQLWYVGDPGTPIVTGTCDATIKPRARFKDWGTSGSSGTLTVVLAPHVGSDFPEQEFAFIPKHAASGFTISDATDSTNIFAMPTPGTGTGQTNAGLVSVYWSGSRWRVRQFSGFFGQDSTTISAVF